MRFLYKLCQERFLIPLSVITFAKPSFGRDDFDKHHQLQKPNMKEFGQFFPVYLACMVTCEFQQKVFSAIF
jgi:hypothetical protein